MVRHRRHRKRGKPTPVGDIIGSVMKGLDIPEDTAERGRILLAWEEIAGSASEYASPVRFRGKTLIVSVDNPAWMTELSMRKAEIIERVNRTAGKTVVDDIRFTVRKE